MLSQSSAANIGLAYLENAILDAIGENHLRPEHLTNMLGLYPEVRINFDGRRVGDQIVRAVLEGLERKNCVQRSEFHHHSWELTPSERARRS